ncbi:hypothetical protein [Foetidibacter luteolus]|uniref:hypothetical protein n=1 Tax=Foetidibacter luteolus TaxID=2608880 RepID=UPI00129B840F|nr:hypothetical protein [Foetidibacter luteolus]
MQEAFTDKIAGLIKLLSFKEGLLNCEAELNKAYGHIDKGIKKTAERFISVFCEHALADTDYTEVQKDAVGYQSLADYIHTNNLSLPYIIKCITYFIWTDKVTEGYFINKIKDNSLITLLNRLDFLLKEHRQLC